MVKVKYNKEKTKKTSVSLSPYYQEIIRKEMATGKFSSISQLISFALLQLERDSLLIDKAKKIMKN
jgi:Arc/MetJ-type ribon-helix-helix transcriptional regulator